MYPIRRAVPSTGKVRRSCPSDHGYKINMPWGLGEFKGREMQYEDPAYRSTPSPSPEESGMEGCKGVRAGVKPCRSPDLGCSTSLSCISKGFGGFYSRLWRLRTGKLSSALSPTATSIFDLSAATRYAP